MTILGIDPGTQRIGYGVIKKDGAKLRYVACGLLSIRTKEEVEMLVGVRTETEKLIRKYKPDYAAFEKLFFAKNRKTAMAVAQSRGVAISAAATHGVEVVEYAPNQVKLAVTGYGGADKRAVAKMVRLMLSAPSLSAIDDASDALAVAIMCAQNIRFAPRGRGVDKKPA